jgi:hypothetical protein
MNRPYKILPAIAVFSLFFSHRSCFVPLALVRLRSLVHSRMLYQLSYRGMKHVKERPNYFWEP